MRFRSKNDAEDTEVEWIDVGGSGPPSVATGHPAVTSLSVAGLVFAVLVIGVFVWALTGGSASDTVKGPTPPTDPVRGEIAEGRSSQLEQALMIARIPRPLLAAELFGASPNFETVNGLFDAIGGIEGATVGSAEGNFDLVTFNPLDNNQLLASLRSSYGSAENQLVNESWTVTGADGLHIANPDDLRGERLG